MASAEVVAVLGAGGTMGLPMARNLARSGIEVRAWNRSRPKAQPLVDDGATVVDTPAEGADGATVIVTMVADADAVIDSMDGEDGALARAAAGSVWVQMSTIGEVGTERCAELAARAGVKFVDAPVLGSKQPAEAAQLVVVASGPEGLRGRLTPIFDAVGKRTMWVGEAGAGTRLKLVINSWIVAVVEGGAETIALAEGLGVDPGLFFEAIEGGALDLPYLRTKREAIARHDFDPQFRLALAAKDARLVEEAARRRALDLPLATAIRMRLEEGVEEHGDKDMIATYLTSAREGASPKR